MAWRVGIEELEPAPKAFLRDAEKKFGQAVWVEGYIPVDGSGRWDHHDRTGVDFGTATVNPPGPLRLDWQRQIVNWAIENKDYYGLEGAISERMQIGYGGNWNWVPQTFPYDPNNMADEEHEKHGHFKFRKGFIPKGEAPEGGVVDAAKVIDDAFRNAGYYPWIPFKPIGRIIREEAWGWIDAALACAVVEQEAGGKNLFGCDHGSTWVDTPPFCQVEVNKPRVKALIDNINDGGGQNGVGLTQLTTLQFVLNAEAMGGAHLPRYQCRVGFRLLHDYILGYGYLPGLEMYNDGTPNRQGGGVRYANEVAEKHAKWKRILAGTDYQKKPTTSPPRPRPKPPDKRPDKPLPSPPESPPSGCEKELAECRAVLDEIRGIVAVNTQTISRQEAIIDELRNHQEPEEQKEETPSLPKKEPALTIGAIGSIIAPLIYLTFGPEAAGAVPVEALNDVGFWLSLVLPAAIGAINRQFVYSPATVEKKLQERG